MARALRYLLLVGGAMVSILLFLLASAAGSSDLFERYYTWLWASNAAVTVALLFVVCLLLIRLYQRYKKRLFGSRLTARLVLLFAVMGIMPVAIIYGVAFQFVSKSIESWFDVRIETALDSGLNLSRAALETSKIDLTAKAHSLASTLVALPEAGLAARLTQAQTENGWQDALLVDGNGRLLASTGKRAPTSTSDLPTAEMLREARLGHGFAAIEGGSEPLDSAVPKSGKLMQPAVLPPAQEQAVPLRLRVVVALPEPPAANSFRYLQLLQPVAASLAANAEIVRAASSEYQTRSLARSGLRKMYIGALTLTLLLAVFGAIAGAFLIADNLAKPLLVLAEGTQAVAEGDLSPRPIVSTNDELGTLTQSFNSMTRQLFDARTAVEKNRAELQNAKAHLESVLANMSAGVMVLDQDFRLVSCNDSVERILQHALTGHIGQELAAIADLAPFAEAINTAFSEQSAQTAANGGSAGKLHWQQQIEIPRRNGEAGADHDITLLTRGSRLPVRGTTGYIVVFDDISDVISAQRSIAWGEVARRLAHEIKNPLTPIQLSAERLQMKLEGKLAPHDMEMLNRGTATIVNQVAAMKRMVDDFRNYAKTPPAVLLPLDLNTLIGEILHLYIAGDDSDVVFAHLAAGLPAVMGDATQLRQVVHNLLQNALDAMSDRGPDAPPAHVDVVTEAVHYQSAHGGERIAVRLSIADNGAGFAPKILTRAFEPYVTSKPRGTGLGLAMVKKIVEEHGGRIDIANRIDQRGAKVSILLLKLASS